MRVGRRSRLVARLRSLHDYVSIALPYVVECKPTLQWAETDKLIDVEVAGDRTSPAEATTGPPLLDGARKRASAPTPCEPPPDPAVRRIPPAARRVARSRPSRRPGLRIASPVPRRVRRRGAEGEGRGGEVTEDGASAPQAVGAFATTALSVGTGRRSTAGQMPVYLNLPARWSLLCLGKSSF